MGEDPGTTKAQSEGESHLDVHVEALGPPSEQEGCQDLWTPDYTSPTQSLKVSANVFMVPSSF